MKGVDLIRYGSTAVLVVVCALVSKPPAWLIYGPFALSVVAWGLPHGAADHVILGGFAGRYRKDAPVLTAVGLYLGLALAFAGLWIFSPQAALGLFLVMTIFHWGACDMADALSESNASLAPSAYISLSALRGSIPVIGPVVFHPNLSLDVLNGILELTRGEAIAQIPYTYPAMVAVLIASCAYVVWLSAISSRWTLHLVDTIILVSLMAIVHPVASVGCYFAVWHGRSHVKRLVRWYRHDKLSILDGRSLWLDAGAISVITILLMIAGSIFLPVQSFALEWYLVVISALTFPHMLVVFGMDMEEGLVEARR